jgi:uncharacterized protein YjiK
MPLSLSPPLQRHLTLALVVTLACTAALTRYLHWDDRALLWFKEQSVPAAERAASIWLPGYKASVEGKPLAGLEEDETSDLTYNPITGTLFTVTGKLPMLVELSRSGEVLRRIVLKGFSNPEGVAVLENGNIAVADERRRNLSIFELTPHTRELDLADAKPFDLGFPDAGNKGFEGVAWDPAQQRLLLGKERTPRMFSLGSDGQHLLDQELQPLPSYGLGMRNLSALSVDPRTGHILAAARAAWTGASRAPRAWPWTRTAPSTWSASRTCSTCSARMSPSPRLKARKAVASPQRVTLSKPCNTLIALMPISSTA